MEIWPYQPSTSSYATHLRRNNSMPLLSPWGTNFWLKLISVRNTILGFPLNQSRTSRTVSNHTRKAPRNNIHRQTKLLANRYCNVDGQSGIFAVPCRAEPSRAEPGRGVRVATQSCRKHLSAALPLRRLNSPKLLRNWPLLGNFSVNTLFQLLEDCLVYGLCRGYITTVPYRVVQFSFTESRSQFSEWVREQREKVVEWSIEEYRRSACEDVKCDSAPIQEVRLEDLRRNTCSDWSASFCVEIRC
jgi:hypothetical protein